MTTSTSTPDSLKAQIAAASNSTTVFSDGSTFDYENGYRNNGAPVATRDRAEKPKIVKSHKIVTGDRVMGVLGSFIILGLLATGASFGVSTFQKLENSKAVKAAINDSGYEVVGGSISNGEVIVRDTSNENLLKWEIAKAHEGQTPVALVFAAPGEAAEMSIPLPHDPSNPFYVAPSKEEDEKH